MRILFFSKYHNEAAVMRTMTCFLSCSSSISGIASTDATTVTFSLGTLPFLQLQYPHTNNLRAEFGGLVAP